MSEKMELKRCPCCDTISAFEEGVIGYFVACQSQKCSCRSGIFPTKPMARNAWNTRASSPAQEPVTTDPVAWLCTDDRYPYVKGIVTVSISTVDTWREGDIKFVGLGPIAIPSPPRPPACLSCGEPAIGECAPPQLGRDAVIEDIYACCSSILIEFSDELTEQQRKFICDQISREVALALTGEPK